MIRLLILTKNIIATEELAEKLRFSNYEVFCSTSILEALQNQRQVSNLIEYFPIIIVDATISNLELKSLLPQIGNQGRSIVREVQHSSSEKTGIDSEAPNLFYYLESDKNVEFIRDQFAEIASHYQDFDYDPIKLKEDNSRISDLTLVNMTKLELQAWTILLEQSGEVVSRDELCLKIWGEVSSSRLAQLSTLIKNIKSKFQESNFGEEVIRSIWGKGYRVDLNE